MIKEEEKKRKRQSGKKYTERSNADLKKKLGVRTPRRKMLRSVRTPLPTVRKVRDLKVGILSKRSNAKMRKELGVRTPRGKVQKL